MDDLKELDNAFFSVLFLPNYTFYLGGYTVKVLQLN